MNNGCTQKRHFNGAMTGGDLGKATELVEAMRVANDGVDDETQAMDLLFESLKNAGVPSSIGHAAEASKIFSRVNRLLCI